MPSNTRRKRQPARTSDSPKVTEEIPEDEQWRLVQQSGILEQIPTRSLDETPDVTPDPVAQPESDEIFQCLIYLIPFSSLYALMDVLVHQQYRQEITFYGEASKLIEAVPILAVFIFFTNRHKGRRWFQAFLTLLSCASGMRLFWVVNKGSWKSVMRQAAPLSTIWIYGIVQLHLIPAIISLCVIGTYVKIRNLKITF
ncbi:hypothetical protein CALVIDRAFT_264979 [Calocera viscosa TUFC12733]|uniref:DUF7719 domain-containing protein n=1 Tax=Calocera viscosa (strain TUFC12733) TaxID=1330018 RepID=A0A167J5C9_CALVF|nr:hypothetical protein CALVIDRAFT_264979 [Calocera viscosa TUFC12733]